MTSRLMERILSFALVLTMKKWIRLLLTMLCIVSGANLSAEEAAPVILSLTDVKYTNKDEALLRWQVPPEQRVYRIQPMDDLTEKGTGKQ